MNLGTIDLFAAGDFANYHNSLLVSRREMFSIVRKRH
jgi:hypothetical protein